MTGSVRAVPTAILTAAIVVFALAAGQGAGAAALSGGIVIDSVRVTAKVVGIDPAAHTLTLQMPEGNTRTFRFSKNVKNLAQLKVGDKITATLTDALAVWVQKKGGPPSATERMTESVMLTPKGVPEAAVATKTVRITGKIHHVDTQNRTVTIALPDNRSKTFKVGSNVKNLASLKAGDDVVVRYTEALVISVRKPK
jgi:Cu/Ag efflux protein CusF